MKKSTYL